MAGLYVHIPFCASRCIYCDFCSSTWGVDVQQAYTKALTHELQARSGEARGKEIATIYLGGGTPSVLPDDLLEHIVNGVRQYFTISPNAEITLEANPDDITRERVRNWLQMGFNRLSIGIQSLNDDVLRWLHRRHTAGKACRAVENAYEAGMRHISIDLMYGLPSLDITQWEATLTRGLSLPVEHLSAYCLTLEDGTAMATMVEHGEALLPSDEECEAQYRLLVEKTKAAGFEHYEISNFARPGHHSRHNSGYWDGTPYIGLGAGAHSYDGRTRRANTCDIKAYIRRGGMAPVQTERLTTSERMNEMIFLSLRTRHGLDLQAFEQRYGEEMREALCAQAQSHLAAGRLERREEHIRLTERGIFVSDDVISDLLVGV